MVRKHIKVEPARWYYWGDRLGLLVWQDMPSLTVSLPSKLMPATQPPIEVAPELRSRAVRIVEPLRRFTSSAMAAIQQDGWGAYVGQQIARARQELGSVAAGRHDSGGWRVIACAGREGAHFLAEVIDGPPASTTTSTTICIPGPSGKTFDATPRPRDRPAARVSQRSASSGGSGMSVPMHEWDLDEDFVRFDVCPLIFHRSRTSRRNTSGN